MNLKPVLSAALACATVLASTQALAGHHRHGGPRVHLGLHFGAPVYWGPRYYYPPAYYYYPPAVIVPSAPPAYIERSDEAERANDSWYYCADAKAYYPYVKQCPGGWQRVSPQPG